MGNPVTGIVFELLYLGSRGLAIVLPIFWIWMIVDCLTKEPEGSDKVAWVLFILMVPLIGALCYFFVRRPLRQQQHGK